MPSFVSTGGEWIKVDDPKGPQPVPQALSLPVRHIQRRQLSEGKVTIQPNPPKPVKASGQPEGASNANMEQRGRDLEASQGKNGNTSGRSEGSDGPNDIRGRGPSSESGIGHGESRSPGDALGSGPASDLTSKAPGNDSTGVHGHEQTPGTGDSGKREEKRTVRANSQKPKASRRRATTRRTRTKSS